MNFAPMLPRKRPLPGRWIGVLLLVAISAPPILAETGKAGVKPAPEARGEELAGQLKRGRPAASIITELENKAYHGEGVTEDEMFFAGRLLRAEGRWDDAAVWYAARVASTPPGETRDRVIREWNACAKLASGWQLPDDEGFATCLQALRTSYAITPPAQFETAAAPVAKSFPERWEIQALRARNFLRMGNAVAAGESLSKAEKVGGLRAQSSVSILSDEISRERELTETGKKAAALIKSGKGREAAVLLEKAWEKTPHAVEFGLKSCQLKTKNRDFTDAAALTTKIRKYLSEHPEHPMAIRLPLLTVVEERALAAVSLRNQIGATPKAAPKTGNKPAATKPGKSGKSGSSGGGSMADKFRKRTG